MRDGFEEQVLPLLPALYRGARNLTRDASDAEDLMQETLIRAYRFFHQFREDTNLKGWLFKILTNTFINEYRKQQRRPQTVSQEDVGDWFLYSKLREGAEPSAEATVLESLGDEDVRAALAALPAQFQIAVLLADVEGFSYREIARITGVPIGTVMSRIHRGRNALEKQLWHALRRRGLVRDDV